jgi:hypothetical protein
MVSARHWTITCGIEHHAPHVIASNPFAVPQVDHSSSISGRPCVSVPWSTTQYVLHHASRHEKTAAAGQATEAVYAKRLSAAC